MPPSADPGAPFPDIERLYSSGGLTRSEYRFLLRRKKNKLHWLLANEYLTKLNALRIGVGARIELRGFLHPPPAAILTLFNFIRYGLEEELGSFEIVLFSPAIDTLDLAIPAIIPSGLVPSKKWPRAHFGTIEGTITEFTMFDPDLHGRFVIVTDLKLLSYEEVFRLTPPDIDFHDVCDMFKSRFRFNFPAISKATFYYLFSSPSYEGRAGGNTLAPISSFQSEYACDLHWIRTVITELHGILPDWLLVTKRKTTFDYLSPVSAYLKFPDARIQYRYNSPIPRAVKWFIHRRYQRENERDVTITPFGLDAHAIFKSIRDVPLPVPISSEKAQALSFADIPLLFTNQDGMIEPSEKEIFDYQEDIGQIIYTGSLELGRTILHDHDRDRGVTTVLKWVEKEWPELHQLMRMGLIFETSPIGGLGEHLTRLAHAFSRATGDTLLEALPKSENLIYDLYIRFWEDLGDYTKQILGRLEDAQREARTEMKRSLQISVESALLELDLVYPEGWTYDAFEQILKPRVDVTRSTLQKYFAILRQQGDVQECSPGLFQTVRGFERY